MKVIFLSYINRSGSTFFVNQLSKYPEVAVCPEADILYDWLLTKPNKKATQAWLLRFARALAIDIKWQAWKLPEILLDSYEGSRLDLFLELLENFKKTHYPNTDFILYKHNHALKLAELYHYDKQLKWLNLVRNPYAVYASQKQTVSPTTGKKMCTNPLAFVAAWNAYLQSTNLCGEMERVHTIYYEDLLTDLNCEVVSVAGFIGIQTNWNAVKEKTGEVSDWLDSDYKEIHQSIDQDPISDYAQKWKSQLSQVEIGVISNRLNKNLQYKAENFSGPLLKMQMTLLLYRIRRKSMYIRNWMQNQFKSHD